jgi:hypothetical protein
MKNRFFPIMLMIITILALGWIEEVVPRTQVMASSPSQQTFVEQLTVISTEEHDRRSGPQRTSSFLAPNGQYFAYWNGPEICIVPVAVDAAPEDCFIIFHDKYVVWDSRSIRWSPDSRYLVLTEDLYEGGADPDIWVIDTSTGKSENITDDQVDWINRTDPDFTWGDIDLSPRWSPDGTQLMFIRYASPDPLHSPPTLFTIAPDGSDLTFIGELPFTGSISTFALDWSPDGEMIAFNHFMSSEDDFNGVWIADSDGRNPRKIAGNLEDKPVGVEFSPDGRYLLIENDHKEIIPFAENSLIRVIPVDGGESVLVDDEYWVRDAGWSPSGHALVYLVYRQPAASQEDVGLYISSGPGEPGRLVLPGEDFRAPTAYGWQTLIWADENIILISPRSSSILVVKLGSEE